MSFADLIKKIAAPDVRDTIVGFNGRRLSDQSANEDFPIGNPINVPQMPLVLPERSLPLDATRLANIAAQTGGMVAPNVMNAANAQANDLPSRTPIPQPPSQMGGLLDMPRSQQIQGQINDITAKDYGKAQYDADGNLTKASGSHRDKNWSWKEKLAGAIFPVLESIGEGRGVLGGIGESFKGAQNRNFFEEREDNQQLGRLLPQLQQAQAQEQFQNQIQTAAVNRQNVIDDNNRANREFDERMKYNRDEQARKIGDRESRAETARLNAISGMFKNIPSFDPDDPNQAELANALKSVGLPLTKKDAKKNVKLIQDQRSGAWSVVLTDPVNGKQETRDVKTPDGSGILKTTPQVVVAGEYGMLRQDDQQEFTAGENKKKRDHDVVMANLENDLRIKLQAVKDAEQAVRDEKNAERRQQLQTQAEQAKAALTTANNAFKAELKLLEK